MKLDLNFDLYKGKTALKHWWGEVKKHFTSVQEAHNALEDTVAAEKTKLSTEIAQRKNKDAELNARIDGEVTARTNADSALVSRITSETQARIAADDEIKEFVEQFRVDYLGGSTAAFEWIGEPPEAELSSPTNPEPVVSIDLSGMFKLDGVSCGTMTGTYVLLNYIEENPDGNIEYNSGVTYVIASFNPKTKQINVTSSDSFVESSVANNIWTLTVARYFCTIMPTGNGGYAFVANGGSPYKASVTVGKENLSDAIAKIGERISSEMEERIAADNELDAKIDNKIDKAEDKGLSENDYTTAEKTKLAGIATGANNYTHPSSHAASMITQDSTHRFVTDSEKTAWNSKVDKVAGKGLSSNDFTDEYIEKIDSFAGAVEGGVVTGVKGGSESTYRGGNVNVTKANIGLGNVDNTSDANKPISTAVQTALNGKASSSHGHSASAITTDSTHRFVTDSEKNKWNNKADADHTHFQPQWEETGPAEWTTDVDLVCPNLSVSNGLYFNSNGYLSIDEVTEAINEIKLKLGI